MSYELPDTLLNLHLGWATVLLGLCFSLVTLIASLVMVILVLVHLPAGYYRDNHFPALLAAKPCAVWYWVAVLGRNSLGLLLIVLGLILSVPGVPGQGLLTILVGFLLLDFPGKHQLERKLVGRPAVLRAVNRLRERFGKPHLVFDTRPKPSGKSHQEHPLQGG